MWLRRGRPQRWIWKPNSIGEGGGGLSAVRRLFLLLFLCTCFIFGSRRLPNPHTGTAPFMSSTAQRVEALRRP